MALLLTTERPTGRECITKAQLHSIDVDAEALEALGLDGFAWDKLSVRLQGKRRMFLKAFKTFDRRRQEENAGMTYEEIRNFDSKAYCCNVYATFYDRNYSQEILGCPDCALIAAKFGLWDRGFKLSIQNGSLGRKEKRQRKELAALVLRAMCGMLSSNLDIVDVYEQMAEDLKGDEELARIALSKNTQSNGRMFDKMSAELQEREDLQKVLIFDIGESKWKSRYALKLVPDSSPYKCVKEKVLEAVRFLSGNFAHVSKELRGDVEVIQAAIGVENFENMTEEVIDAAMGEQYDERGKFSIIVKSIDAEGFLAAGEGNGALLEEWRTIVQRKEEKARKEYEEYFEGDSYY